MSLLQNQDFIIYRIRSRYLQSMKDGVGERLITLNPTALNVPAFKNAGWGATQDIKRTYSPPIPSGTTGEYFANTNVGKTLVEETTPRLGIQAVDDGALLGSRFSAGSEDGGGRTPRADGGMRNRAMQHREEDDSSDMSDDSDDDDQNMDRPSQKLHFDFTKKELPHRPRAGSSPIRNAPQVLLTSPSLSKNRTRGRTRGGSHGDVDYKFQEHPDSVPGADEHLLSSGIMTEHEQMHADIANKLRSSPNSSLPQSGYDSGDDSDASSTMSSDFIQTADSNPDGIGTSLSPPIRVVTRTFPGVLNALPPPIRPVSMVQPVSALTLMLKAKENEVENPMKAYRFLSGKGEPSPVHLKIYIPYRKDSSPFEIIINRMAKTEEGAQSRETTVAEAIGYTVYRYVEDGLKPALDAEQLDINRWTFRMVDDGEPDDDFPPLERTKTVSSYMTKTMPRGGRLAGGNREVRMEGEFALVEATEEQYLDNCRVTPSQTAAKKPATSTLAPVTTTLATSAVTSEMGRSPAPTVGPSSRQVAADIAAAASAAGTTFTPRTGPSKILRIHVASIDQFAQSISVCVTTDTYIAEVLEQVCRKKNLDKSKFVLRVTGAPNVIAPLDRTVASLGDRGELDLARRRFLGASEGIGDRPGSPSTVDSPNAPLIISETPTGRTPKKGKFLHPALWTPDMLSSRDYLKFTVWRKASMSMSFMSRHERILAIDGEYVHIMPSDQKTLLFAIESQAKTRSIHISTIIGCKTYRKAPSNFKILVMRPQKETKRYDFEAMSEQQAEDVVNALRKAIMEFRMDHHSLAY